jgi:formimidoylglutamate deiminase
MHHLTAEWALLEDGFAPSVRIGVRDGLIASVEVGSAGPGERVAGVMLPGMADVHSHGFQRVFAGQTNWVGGGGDFWSWREAMYRAVASMTPDLYRPVFTWLCKALLKGGYTSLAEFHYLQHLPDGGRYVPETAMADALIAGAAQAGMPLTMLVGIYETGGFDGEALAGGQRRFDTRAEDARRMAADLQGRAEGDLVVGLAPHSLRAVPPRSLARAVDGFSGGPIHIHVAEQMAEVADCTRILGAPPVAWLLDHAPVGARWCLIHATHATPAELAAVARAGAVIGLCPSTEADLGDGIFDFPCAMQAGVAFGIGTDSNTALDALGELRLLEYAQRLAGRRRNVAAGAVAHSGQALWAAAARGGAQACGRDAGVIAVGKRADFTVLGATLESAGLGPEFVLDSAMFAAVGNCVSDVMIGGSWVVRDGSHFDETAIDAAYVLALTRVGLGPQAPAGPGQSPGTIRG